MLLTFLIIAFVIFDAFVIMVALQPADFRITRSATINAPAETIFPLINDLHNWAAWSPWDKLDPTMKKTHDGSAAGVGASYHWNGNNKVGEGRMTITESRAPSHIGLKLEFLRPMRATNQTVFTLTSGSNGTTVEWAMTGKNNFVAKAFCMFMNMDKMVGKDFEKGLAQLKAVAEA